MTFQEKINKANRILIKIGTSTITKNHKLNLNWIKQKTEEIARLKNKGKEIIIISSGAVGAGMEVEKISERPKNALSLQLLSGKGQVRLMKIYTDLFKPYRIQTAQVLLTHYNFDTAEEVKNIKEVVNAYLKNHTIPIINTNDVVTKEELLLRSKNVFTDNDELAALVAENLNVDLLVMLTDVDGLCTLDPRKNTCYELIPVVEQFTKEIEDMASKEGSIMGTGGMLSKIMTAKKVGKKGILTIVANGKQKVQDILDNKVKRTLFLP
ncbi:MAG: glutamate 5-kinase [Candidatus Woesearchaeota archaeon]|jgi:glutamate 5-kinase|nr:glutamate 5-kinase [Candidatus Woesearchaeota archaeon]